jgi:pyruvate/2-oxoglutarate/acetoin dehydrogenase E1 component
MTCGPHAHAEVIDLLSIKPMDTETLATSVAAGRCAIVAEAPQLLGVRSHRT